MAFSRRKTNASLSLTTSLAIAFFCVSVVVVLISSSLQIASDVQSQQEIVSSKQQLIAQDAARTVSNFIQQDFSVLRTTVRLVDLVSAAPVQQREMLDSLLGAQPAFRQLVVLNAQNQEVAHSARISQVAAKQLSDQLTGTMLAQVAQGNNYISSIYIDPITSEPLVFIAVPATNALGDFQGVLAAEVNLKFMWDLVDQIKVGETGSVYVVDRQGNLIAFSDTARVLRGENLSVVQVVQSFIQQSTTIPITEVREYPGITGSMVVGTYVALGTPDWAVVTELPQDEAYRQINQNIIISIAITMAVALLAGLLGVLIARRLATPLIDLTKTVTRITNGEAQLQASVSGPLEIASLATAFNQMTARLRHLVEDLEQRITERTSALRQALGEVEARAIAQEQLVAEIQQQRETIREMSVPVLPVTDSTLVMPLIGALDSQRLRQIQEQALQAIERSSARTIILDITGVLIVDSQVAQGLMVVVQAARLLGTEVLLVGVRPEVAQAIVSLGLSTFELRTYNNLQSALSHQHISIT